MKSGIAEAYEDMQMRRTLVASSKPKQEPTIEERLARLESVVFALRDTAHPVMNHVSLIMNAVATHARIGMQAFSKNKPSRTISEWRFVAMLLCRELTRASNSEIALAFNCTNEGTVSHGLHRARDVIGTYVEHRRGYEVLKQELREKIGGAQ